MTGRPRQARKTTTAEVRPHAARRSPIWSPGSTALRVCAALVRRGRSGHGETVGASLNNGMISMLGFLAANYLATGEPPPRTGNDHAIVAPLWPVSHERRHGSVGALAGAVLSAARQCPRDARTARRPALSHK